MQKILKSRVCWQYTMIYLFVSVHLHAYLFLIQEGVESEDKKEDEEAEPEPVKEEEPDLWEESFKGHADSKPNGNRKG